MKVNTQIPVIKFFPFFLSCRHFRLQQPENQNEGG